VPRPALELADIFRARGPAWRKANAGHVSLTQLKVMAAIEACRTETLGGHVAGCARCGHHHIAYSSCKNRHCPKCKGPAARDWMAARAEALLPVARFGIRHDQRPAQLGLGAHPPSPCPHDRPERRPVAGRHPLGVLPPGLLPACAGAVPAVPASVHRGAAGPPPRWCSCFFRRPGRAGRRQGLRGLAGALSRSSGTVRNPDRARLRGTRLHDDAPIPQTVAAPEQPGLPARPACAPRPNRNVPWARRPPPARQARMGLRTNRRRWRTIPTAFRAGTDSSRYRQRAFPIDPTHPPRLPPSEACQRGPPPPRQAITLRPTSKNLQAISDHFGVVQRTKPCPTENGRLEAHVSAGRSDVPPILTAPPRRRSRMP
jgi:hypothetical protein